MVIYRTLELELVGPWLVRSSVRRPSVIYRFMGMQMDRVKKG
jgi:hypothetical protein